MTESATSRPFIREALESGINFFDTADMYSLGLHLDAMRCYEPCILALHSRCPHWMARPERFPDPFREDLAIS
jgi:predicted aldo/keto reductase-like oxidoreductase